MSNDCFKCLVNKVDSDILKDELCRLIIENEKLKKEISTLKELIEIKNKKLNKIVIELKTIKKDSTYYVSI